MECLLSGSYNLPLREDWQEAWQAVAPVTWSAVGGVARAIPFAEEIQGFKKSPGMPASLLSDSVDFASRDELFSGDPQGALRLFWLLDEMSEAPSYDLRRIADAALDGMYAGIRRLPKAVVSGSLPLRFLSLSLRQLYDGGFGGAKARKAITSLISDAEKAGAGELVTAARELLLEEEEDDGDSRFGGGDAPDFDLPGPVSQMVEDFMEAIASGNNKRIRELKAAMEKIGMAPPESRPGGTPPQRGSAKKPQKPKPKPAKPAKADQEEFPF